MDVTGLDRASLAKLLDHSLLYPYLQECDILRGIEDCKQYGFGAIYVGGCWLPLASDALKGYNIDIGAGVGFPSGMSSSVTKLAEAEDALKKGATILDLQINTGFLKDQRYKEVLTEMCGIAEVARGRAVTKMIVEVSYLTREEIIVACQLVAESGADYAKTSGNRGERGPSLWEVKLMREVLPSRVKVEASGLSDAFSTAIALACLRAGADRIGTCRAVEVVEGLEMARTIGLC